jgi:very-short-patch-repair endonuclease
MTEIAREFRKQPTPSEAILWQALRGRKLDGRKFKRQQPIGAFIVDFFCGAERLVVEVDGGVHETQQEYDQQRQELLESLGLRFVRVSSQQVETDLNGVLETIRAAFDPHPLTPSPKGGEGEPEAQSPSPLVGEGFRVRGSEGLKPRYEYFRKVLAEMAKHPNPRYFVLKSIMLNNLYGVDIMEEATEICKLRLFLKLVAQMEPQPKKQNFGLEPLPDIDFNIRAGNTLVGFASLDEVRKTIKQDGDQLKLDLQDDASRINEKAELADRAFQRFRQMQTEFGMDAGDFRTAKKELRRRLAELNDELNHYLAREYGIDVNKPAAFEKWRDSHQPFHWFVEFYSIIDRGGFDVIIGNPPYVELSKIHYRKSLKELITEPTGNLYCPVVERSCVMAQKLGRLGMILPMSLSCTERMSEMREFLESRDSILWISHFSGDANPSVIFEGVKFRLDILILASSNQSAIFSSSYCKWFSDARSCLFSTLTYVGIALRNRHLKLIPKTGTKIAYSSLEKILDKKPISNFFGSGSKTLYIHRVITMFIKCFDFIPYFWNETDGIKKSEDYKPFSFQNDEQANISLGHLEKFA